MNENDLSKMLENATLTEEQKKAIFDVIKNKPNQGTTEVKNTTVVGNKKKKTPVFTEAITTTNLTKLDRPTVDKSYIYSDIPCRFDIFKIFYLANTNMLLNKNSNLIGAFLLKWINESKIKYRLIKTGFFKSEAYAIETDPTLKFDNQYENAIYEFILRACGNDNLVTTNEFKKFCEKRSMEIETLLNEICDIEEKKLVDGKLLNKSIVTTDEYLEDKQNPLNTEGIKKSTTVSTYSHSDKLNDEIKNILGFKNYIKSLQFSEITSLPNDYFVVTELLGITNYISAQFNEIYPEFYFRYYQFLNKLRTAYPQPATAFDRMIELGRMEMK